MSRAASTEKWQLSFFPPAQASCGPNVVIRFTPLSPNYALPNHAFYSFAKHVGKPIIAPLKAIRQLLVIQPHKTENRRLQVGVAVPTPVVELHETGAALD